MSKTFLRSVSTWFRGVLRSCTAKQAGRYHHRNNEYYRENIEAELDGKLDFAITCNVLSSSQLCMDQ